MPCALVTVLQSFNGREMRVTSRYRPSGFEEFIIIAFIIIKARRMSPSHVRQPKS
jgi:hypothetical protein